MLQEEISAKRLTVINVIIINMDVHYEETQISLYVSSQIRVFAACMLSHEKRFWCILYLQACSFNLYACTNRKKTTTECTLFLKLLVMSLLHQNMATLKHQVATLLVIQPTIGAILATL